MNEFEAIARLFRPLAQGAAEAADLLDDAAFLSHRPGHDLVITTDALVEGVHFLLGERPDRVARKLLRVNLSDLAAKGAEPYGYLLVVAWPAAWDDAARSLFAEGLRQDQERYGLKLLGGDTVSTPGPMTASVTALGYARAGTAVRRSGARRGDGVYVSGAIGDGWLGLQAARGELDLASEHLDALAARYHLPEPRVELRSAVLDRASACVDVSDGLVADAGHIASASGVSIALDLDAVPLSPGAQAWLERQPDRTAGLLQLATGGDDYELLMTGGFDDAPAIRRIGEVGEGEGVRVLSRGVEVPVASAGWRHP